VEPDPAAARKLFLWLAAGAALFTLRAAFEMFVLTPRFGPQMLFFSLIHVWPLGRIILFGLSGLAYALLVPLTLWQLVVAVVQKPRRARWDTLLAVALALHVAALASYGVWAPALFTR
jgi:hypothetical protein